MLLLFGPQGGVVFQYTRTYFVQNYPDFIRYAGKSRGNYGGSCNFGAGNEYSFICPYCNRKLPMAIVEVDHIHPRTSLSYEIKEGKGNIDTSITRNGSRYTFMKEGKFKGIWYSIGATIVDYNYSIVNNIFHIKSDDHDLATTNLQNTLVNDIENLQLICGYCNRSKGNR